MLERAEPILKFVCLAVAVLLLQQLVVVSLRLNPLGGAAIPEVPTWSPTPSPAASDGPGIPHGSPPSSTPPAPPEPHRPPQQPNSIVSGPPVFPEIQKRIERITESGVLGPVIRPPPMALLGIAGPDVLLRAPNGQTGLLREGGELGGIKLLRVGTNRVLVEENGESKELLIFGGFGGESLLPNRKEGTP